MENKIHRVTHPKIPVSAFHPENGKPKVLRWFQNEQYMDGWLQVEDERDGTFVLRANYFARQMPDRSTGVLVPISVGAEILSQAIVNEIEVATQSEPLRDCHFVIFQNSPRTRQLCETKKE